jgi:hypothetical protein
MYAPALPLHGAPERSNERSAVVVVEDDLYARIPASDYMLNRARSFESRLTRHDVRVAEIHLLRQMSVSHLSSNAAT